MAPGCVLSKITSTLEANISKPTPSELNGRDVILKQHNVLEVLKSLVTLPKGEGPIVQV